MCKMVRLFLFTKAVITQSAITAAFGCASTYSFTENPIAMTPSTTSNSVTRHHPRVSPKKKMTIPQSLIPPNRAKINIKLAEEHWCYANHFDKNLPKSDPEDRHLQKYADILRSVLDNTYNKLHDRLLEHLQHLTRKYGILATSFENHSSKNIDSIHKAVLSSTHRFSDQYLSMVLEFLKMPQKQEVEWLRLATEDVKNQYDIEFEFGKRNFVQEYAKKTFNDLHNQRLRRGMASLGTVWYDRLPSEQKRRTVFGNATTDVVKKEVWFGPKVMSGYLVRKVGQKANHIYSGLEKELIESKSEDVFIEKAKNVWRKFKEDKASNCCLPCLLVSMS